MGQARSTTFVVDTGRFLWVIFLSCLIIEIALVYLDLTVNWLRWSEYGPIRRLFNITREDGLASWFAITQTFLVALSAWFIYLMTTAQNTSWHRRIGWLLVAVFFTYMAIDDGAAVHERLGSTFKQSHGIGAFPSYAWQLLFLPFFAVMGCFLLYFLWRELTTAKERWIIVTAIGCFVVAVILDFIEGMDDAYRWLINNLSWQESTIKHFSKSIEEFIEMMGMSLFLVSFLGFIAQGGHVSVRFVSTKPLAIRKKEINVASIGF